MENDSAFVVAAHRADTRCPPSASEGLELAHKRTDALLKAMIANHTEDVKALLECSDERDEGIKRVFYEACRRPSTSPELIKILLEHGADPNSTNSIGYSALSVVSRSGRVQVMHLLLEHGADVNFQSNPNGRAPLSTAAKRGSLEAVQLLLSHGADINATCLKGKTALHYACRRRNPNILLHLIAHGADLNVGDASGQSPLHEAVQLARRKFIPILIEHGADLYSRTTDGKTPLAMSLQWGRKWNPIRTLDTTFALMTHGAVYENSPNNCPTYYGHRKWKKRIEPPNGWPQSNSEETPSGNVEFTELAQAIALCVGHWSKEQQDGKAGMSSVSRNVLYGGLIVVKHHLESSIDAQSSVIDESAFSRTDEPPHGTISSA
ncbi:hypothetical protein Poli38472_001936 [Pythium oligandrum]|uniref:Ankyrin repeat protein n=1 Tax=Pythium oligandrum TaxID=41045 RepID=A0A8K1FMV5_PYTOL|nr:hypothetical protein Poli38472_001936 [Pythium oligandrum]|eukprot:TMW69780.1 hypothetical protein Poli38472_001936 [Pythium oligandrum]